MFDIYKEKKTQPLFYAAIGGAIASFAVAVFFREYFDLHQIPFPILFVVPVIVLRLIMDSDYRTRGKIEEFDQE